MLCSLLPCPSATSSSWRTLALPHADESSSSDGDGDADGDADADADGSSGGGSVERGKNVVDYDD